MSERRPVVMISLGIAVALGLLGAAVFFAGARPPAKPSGPLAVELRGMIAIDSPPQLVRAFVSGGKLSAGESLLLRARLSRPAWLLLLAQKPGSGAEPIWPAAQEEHPAGEFELGAGDQLLALQPSLFTTGAVLALLACEKPLDENLARTRNPLAGSAEFPGCAKALLSIAASR